MHDTLTRRLFLVAGAAMARAAGRDGKGLEAAFQRIAPAAGGVLGATAIHVETGDRASLRGTERFAMASVYKFPIAVEVLRRVDAGSLRLDQAVRLRAADRRGGRSPLSERMNGRGLTVPASELLRLMVSESDNTASDVLLRLVGGPAAVTAMLRGLGINDMEVSRSEGELARARDKNADARDTATPDAMAALLVKMQRGELGLRPASALLLRAAMTETPTGPLRLKGLLPPGTPVAHKTGTWGEVEGVNAATNDAGLIKLPSQRGHLAVAVFVKQSRAPLAVRERAIAEIAKAAWDHWTAS